MREIEYVFHSFNSFVVNLEVRVTKLSSFTRSPGDYVHGVRPTGRAVAKSDREMDRCER
jgi:hypothetical protein